MLTHHDKRTPQHDTHQPNHPDEPIKPHTQHKNIQNPGYLDHPEILKTIPKIGRTW